MDDPSTTSSSANRTIYVGGLPQGIDEEHLVSAFSAFGEIIDVQIPRDKARSEQTDELHAARGPSPLSRCSHRGFGFLVFSTQSEAQDAIDNMHLNEIYGVSVDLSVSERLPMHCIGWQPWRPELTHCLVPLKQRVLNVNLAKPLKTASALGGGSCNRAVWQDEEWIKQYVKPISDDAIKEVQDEGNGHPTEE